MQARVPDTKNKNKRKNHTIHCPHEAYSQVERETINDYKNKCRITTPINSITDPFIIWFKTKCILHEANI